MRATEEHGRTRNASVSLVRHSARLDAVAFAGMFVFGIVMALLGAVIPVLSGRLRLDLGDAGTLFLVTNGGILIAGSIVTSWRPVSSASRMFFSVIRFMWGQRLQGRMNSTSG